jgi:carbon storage regulator
MLTLTRRAGERIRIGDDIVVLVREVRGGHVKIGIEAPRSCPVYRGELYDAIQTENQAASQASQSDLTAALGRLATTLPAPRPAVAAPGAGGSAQHG